MKFVKLDGKKDVTCDQKIGDVSEDTDALRHRLWAAIQSGKLQINTLQSWSDKTLGYEGTLPKANRELIQNAVNWALSQKI